MTQEKFIKVAEIENQFEAQLIGEILDQEQIPFYIQSYHDMAYDGIFTLQLGWGGLYVCEAQAQHVIQLLKEVMKEYLSTDHTEQNQ